MVLKNEIINKKGIHQCIVFIIKEMKEYESKQNWGYQPQIENE